MPDALVDARARARIATSIDENLYAEAGAGAGKTHSLVERIVSLLTGMGGEREPISIDAIAAITFTEKAATELRERVRHALSSRDELPSVRDALDRLDAAAICTLHAFAQRLLVAHSLDAGLPIRIEVMDEISSNAAFAERWTLMRRALLDDPALERSIALLAAGEIRLDRLAALARRLDSDWDMVAERRHGLVADPPARIDVRSWFDRAEHLAGQRSRCFVDDDLLAQRLDLFAVQLNDLRARLTDADELDEIDLLVRAAQSLPPLNVGRAGAWGGAIDEIRDELRSVRSSYEELIGAQRSQAVAHLGGALAVATLTAADERRRTGRLMFHDLLVLARDLLVHHADVRREIHAQYRVLLIDEFQDTDPIQFELALLISADPSVETSSIESRNPLPSRLFVVGDPKQSIYRFRRADIGLYRSALARLAPDEAHGAVTLSTNFRSTPAILAWVNTVFAVLMRGDEQASFGELRAHRKAHHDARAPMILGADLLPPRTAQAEVRAREADDIAAAIASMLATGKDGVLVRDRSVAATAPGTKEPWRRARPGDIAILLPSRASLEAIERSLDALGIASRAESSSLVYGAREVRDVMIALRAADDPGDGLAAVSALRSPLFGCSDRELAQWRWQGGVFDCTVPPPPDGPAAVADALAVIRELHGRRAWDPPAVLIDRLIERTALFELAPELGPMRSMWRRLRFVTDQARAWASTQSSERALGQAATLRAYLRWVAAQAGDGSRVVEAVLPETDDDAVRILTIHASKGLEFPIVVLGGLSTRPQGPRGGVELIWTDDAMSCSFNARVQSGDFAEHAAIEEQMSADERVRLLYVGCTRAQDQLVIALHRAPRHRSSSGAPSNAELLADAITATHPVVRQLPPQTRLGLSASFASHAIASAPELPDRAQWNAERSLRLLRASAPSTIGASQLARRDGGADPLLDEDDLPELDPIAAGWAKGPRDLDRPAWERGRYGTAVGRAVHAVLQQVDLGTGDGVAGMVAAQAVAEGVANRERLIGALVRSALAHPLVMDAAARRHWRELYVATLLDRGPDGGGDPVLLEGYVDLVVEADDGLVVVDHKTDAVDDIGELVARAASYRTQVAAYAEALERATGRLVPRCVLLFLAATGATEVVIEGDDLGAARAEVRRSLLGSSGPSDHSW
jgi:ATP-dependent helicase/nuclease subunit A